METVIPVLAIVTLVVSWNVFLYKRSGGRAWSPLWMAFSATAAAALFLVAGLLGYTLSRHTRFVDGTAWTGTVIWWQVAVGAVAATAAVYFWRAGLRSIRSS